MLCYQKLKNKPRILQSLTGLTLPEFETLLSSFEIAWQSYVQENFIDGKQRKRSFGAGRKAELESLQDKQLFILFYLRIYPIQELQGFLFNLSQSQANEWIHRLTKVLNQA
ncbi:MAG: transposase family protein [Xenococcus sp. (in: cyanobacteria)]